MADQRYDGRRLWDARPRGRPDTARMTTWSLADFKKVSETDDVELTVAVEVPLS